MTHAAVRQRMRGEEKFTGAIRESTMRRKRILIVLVGTLVVLGVAFAVVAWRPGIAAVEPPDTAAFEQAQVTKGAQLALIGNCNSCHTAPGLSPYGGGRALATPFGTIHSTNITPDPDTGIGRWSEAAFRRAMHEGVARDGRHLYPAFPFDHFAKLSTEDVGALYAFLMTRAPVRAQPPANALTFPFNLRPLIAGWKLLYLKPGPFRPDATKDPEWNRGAYLVEALAHCGACHTPRNALGAEMREQFFAGGESEGWHAPALNTASPSPVAWTTDQLFAYLRHGFVEPHGVAAGPMRPVTDNLLDVAEPDVRAIAAYVGSILGPATAARPAGRERFVAGTATSNAGKIYAGACAPCHEPSDQNFSARGIHPAQSKAVALPDPRNLIHVILDGIEPPAGAPTAAMPGFRATFTEEQLAGLVSFIRANFSDRPAWNNVQDEVRKLRRDRNGS